jgi:sulfite exporter TauE/SafE
MNTNTPKQVNAHTICGAALIVMGVGAIALGLSESIAQTKIEKSASDVSNIVNTAQNAHSLANFIKPTNIVHNSSNNN